jgi:hypothetical protein
MTMSLKFSAFYKGWVAAFREASGGLVPTGREWWEGIQAYRDLERAKMLTIVIPDQELPFKQEAEDCCGRGTGACGGSLYEPPGTTLARGKYLQSRCGTGCFTQLTV